MKLKKRVALVTGGGEGIGRAIALRFAKEGADITIADINFENAKKVSKEILSLGRESLAIKTDVSKQKEVNQTVKRTINKFKKIDILVNNAGISKISPFVKTTESIWNKILDTNLKGTFFCCKAVIPYMLRQKSGKIINLSSQSGKKGNSQYAAYCASKFGIIGLTQSIALEFAPYGININAICPNIVFTTMWKKQLNQYAQKYNLSSEKVKDFLLSKIPLGRFPKLEEITNVVLFLASDESSYITGQAINITGGQLLT